MEVAVLIENYYKKHDRKLKCEHGLSLHITTNGLNILFDTGDTDAIIENAKQMDINLEKVDIAILSHAHSDHCGGLQEFLQINNKAQVYMSKHATNKYYFKMSFIKKNIGIPKQIFDQHLERISFIEELSQISPGIYLVPNSRIRAFPIGESSKELLMEKDGKITTDDFQHEISLVFKRNNTLDIFTGCSHNGISNMVDNVITFFPNNSINSVIGGFHLMGVPFRDRLGETPEFIENLAKKMLTYNIEKIYTAHCTGKKAFKILEETLGEKITYINTGDKLEI